MAKSVNENNTSIKSEVQKDTYQESCKCSETPKMSEFNKNLKIASEFNTKC